MKNKISLRIWMFLKDLFDELARENLRRADSVCLKTAYAIGVIAIFSAVMSARLPVDFPEITGVLIGHCVVFLMLLLTALRAVVFSIIDKRGI